MFDQALTPSLPRHPFPEPPPASASVATGEGEELSLFVRLFSCSFVRLFFVLILAPPDSQSRRSARDARQPAHRSECESDQTPGDAASAAYGYESGTSRRRPAPRSRALWPRDRRSARL